MALLTDKMLRRIMPHAPQKARLAALPILNVVAWNYGIRTALRLRFWLSTLALESGELKYQEEIASGAAYEGREDLGNVQKGDGRRFKGRGRIQGTGRDVYAAYTEYLRKSGHLPFVNFVSSPHRLAEEPYATDFAGWFVNGYKQLNRWADSNNFLKYQTGVNGRNRKTGLPNHWAERQAYLRAATIAIPDDFELTASETILALTSADREVLEGTEGFPDFDIIDHALKTEDLEAPENGQDLRPASEPENGLDGLKTPGIGIPQGADKPETSSGAAENATSGDKSMSPQVIDKERPSRFSRWMFAIKAAFGSALLAVTSYCSQSEVATIVAKQGAERVVAGAERHDLYMLLLVLAYTGIFVAAAVLIIWVASRSYGDSADRANNLNVKKLEAASREGANTVEFKEKGTGSTDAVTEKT